MLFLPLGLEIRFGAFSGISYVAFVGDVVTPQHTVGLVNAHAGFGATGDENGCEKEYAANCRDWTEADISLEP